MFRAAPAEPREGVAQPGRGGLSGVVVGRTARTGRSRSRRDLLSGPLDRNAALERARTWERISHFPSHYLWSFLAFP